MPRAITPNMIAALRFYAGENNVRTGRGFSNTCRALLDRGLLQDTETPPRFYEPTAVGYEVLAKHGFRYASKEG